MMSDIRVGDLVRATHTDIPEAAIEGRVTGVGDYDVTVYPCLLIQRDLWDVEVLDRPLPAFEWGTVIGDPHDAEARAVFLPRQADDFLPWVTKYGTWQSDEWAKQMQFANGWQVITAPEVTDE